MTQEAAKETDEELVRAVLAGDRDRFGDLVARYQSRLVNYLFRLLRSSDDAHDLAQEVFLRIYQALDRYDPTYRFSTWIFRVAQNAAIDQIRKRRLRLVPLVRPGQGDSEGVELELPSDDRGPYGHLRNVERGEAVQAAIDALPWEYRELVVLRHYGELSYEEIAQLKRMPLGTVKNKLFRGRQILKERLQSYLTD
ncbi:MAG: sigma-70 family RNA polymerase sigma factor [Thermoanaerobaculia bacterium]